MTAPNPHPIASLDAERLHRLIPERRPVSHHRRGIVLRINQEHLAMVLRVKQERVDA